MRSLKSKPALFCCLSFLIPAVIITAALAGLGVTPFGDNSLAISDGNALYLNYMGYVSQVLKGREDIFFSFTKGLGGNMMGSWGWFLLNPFFALFALADVTNYMETYTFVSMLNFCTCGLTMYILLKDIYGHKGSNLIFSTAYALNGFLVANVFQLNFFSVIPVLPIMVMGLRRILKDQNPVIYILSLAYSLLTNFYFGFMLCVASFLTFTVFFIADRKEIENKKSVAVKYAISSLLGGVLASVVWLPALLSLRGGRLDQSVAYAITIQENMPFLDMFSKLFTGANSTAELSNGLPNIFVGILPVFLVVLFFTNQEVPKRKKAAAAALLAVYLVSFYLAAFNIAMHGGTVTNWFNYRDSFVFCFLMLMIAAEEWRHIADEPTQNLKRAIMVMAIVTLIVFDKEYEYVSGGMVLLDYAILGLMVVALWTHKKDPVKNPRNTLTALTLVLVCVNLFLNYYFSTKNIMEWTHKESEYQEVTVPVGALVEGVQKSDEGFYRMEIGEQRSGNTGNDPMLYGYYGVGHGGSDDRNFVRLALSELGVHRFDMRNYYGRGIPAATDTLLGLRYLISKEDLTEEKGYERLLSIGEWGLYKNQQALPVGMLVNSSTNEVEVDLEDVFDNLNRTWSAMTGVENEVFVEEEEITFSSHNLSDPLELRQEEAKRIISTRDASLSHAGDSSASATGEDSSESVLDGSSESGSNSPEYQTRGTFQEKPENTHYIMYTFTASRDGAVYSYNRSGMSENKGAILPAMNYEGYFHKGDVVTGYLPVTDTFATEYLLEEVAGRFKVAYVDAEALEEMSQVILNRPSTIEKNTDGSLSGTFVAEAGQELLFTIPFDEGWTLTVDGKDTELKKALDVFMVADVEPGEHTYEMKFIPSGFKIGIVAAGISLLLTCIYITLDSKKTGTKMCCPCDQPDVENSADSLEASKAERNPALDAEHSLRPAKANKRQLKENANLNGRGNTSMNDRNTPIELTSSGRQPHSWIIFMMLAVTALVICMKSSYNPFTPFQQATDPSVFEYVGTVMSQGGVMYRDVFDHKGPLLYFLNWLGVVCGGHVWFIEFAFILVSLIGCYRSFRLFLDNKILSSIGTAIVFLPMYSFYEHGNTVEEYALPFIVWGLYFFIQYFHTNKVSNTAIGLCGCFSGCVLLLRPNMIAMWVVFAIAVIVKEIKSPRTLLHLAGLFIAGMLTPFIPAFIYLAANHALVDFIEQYIIFNFLYSTVEMNMRIEAITIFFLYSGSLVVIGVSVVLLVLNVNNRQLCMINLVYYLINQVFIGIGGNTYTHYGIITIPAYLLTTILLINYLKDLISIKTLTCLVTISATLLLLPWLRFIWIELPQRYMNLHEGTVAAVSTLIKDNTKPDDAIIACGNQDIIYLQTKRKAASKYSYQLPIAERDPSIYKKFLQDLETNEPEVLVLDVLEKNGPYDYKNLNVIIDYYLSKHHYDIWAQIGNLKVLGKHPLPLEERVE